MNFFKNLDRNKLLYNGLIITFIILYAATAFVSWYHAITFFNIANAVWLSVLLSFVAEIGQSSVLFAILLSENKNKFLSWAVMVMLTSLQVIGNVVSSYKYIITSNNLDFSYFQQSILFWVQTPDPIMFKIIIAWISGGLLPIIALSMTGLVAQQLNLRDEKKKISIEQPKLSSVIDEDLNKVIENESKKIIKENEEPTYVDIDESGIGGEPTLDEQQKISDFIEEEKLMRELDEDIIDLSPIEAEAKEYDKQIDNALDEQIKLQETLKNINDNLKEEIKKRGRPPKQKETAVEPKKEQGLLQEEENVSVPQEKPTRSRTIDPLKRKSTTQIIKEKDLDKIMKPSKGEEVIKLLESIDKVKTKESTFEPVKDEEISQESLLVPPELRTPYVNTGVEVIDAKAVSKQSQVKKN